MKKILLVGAGYMASEYAKVLNHLKLDIVIVGNTPEKCDKIKELYPHFEVISGGLERYININTIIFSHAIIASPILLLSKHIKILLQYGISNILVEKPGGLNESEMKEIYDLCITQFCQAKIFLAYNRRFYDSVIAARQIINKDGGVLSFSFNINELVKSKNFLHRDKNILNYWFYAMTSHIVDLAFFLGGEPNILNVNNKKHIFTDLIDWHLGDMIFSGSGQTNTNAIFSYHGNWITGGKWRLEVYTRNYVLLFSPVEKLQISEDQGISFTEMKQGENDILFKPGLLEMVNSFLHDNQNLLNYLDHYLHVSNYISKMAGYIH